MLLAIGLFFYACKDLEDEEIEEQKKQLLEKEQQKQPPQKQDEQEQQKQQPLKKAKKLVAGNFTFELNDNSASKDARKTVWVYQGASIALTIENGQRTDGKEPDKKLDFSKANFQWAYRKRDAQEWISLAGNGQTGRVSIPEDARVGAYELKVSAQVEHEIADNSKNLYRFVVRKKGCLPPSSYNAPETDDQLTAALAGTRYIEAIDTSKMRVLNYIGGRGNNFNQPGIGCWDVSNVTSMESAFNGNAEFNQPIGEWDTSRVTRMNGMFDAAAKFNQPIGQWDISKVTTMWSMFKNAAAFNQPIGNWDTANVISMSGMFNDAAAFNQPIGNWDTSKVEYMAYMFRNAAKFNQNLRGWKVGKVEDSDRHFDDGADAWQEANKPDFR